MKLHQSQFSFFSRCKLQCHNCNGFHGGNNASPVRAIKTDNIKCLIACLSWAVTEFEDNAVMFCSSPRAREPPGLDEVYESPYIAMDNQTLVTFDGDAELLVEYIVMNCPNNDVSTTLGENISDSKKDRVVTTSANYIPEWGGHEDRLLCVCSTNKYDVDRDKCDKCMFHDFHYALESDTDRTDDSDGSLDSWSWWSGEGPNKSHKQWQWMSSTQTPVTASGGASKSKIMDFSRRLRMDDVEDSCTQIFDDCIWHQGAYFSIINPKYCLLVLTSMVDKSLSMQNGRMV